MKSIKAIIGICVAGTIIFSSCTNEQKRAEKFVTNYVKERLNDPASYESVSFSDVKKVKRPYEQTATYKIFGDAFMKAKEDFDFAKSFDNRDEMHTNLLLMQEYDSIINARRSEWFPENEYCITHKYRARNAVGGVITTETVFFMDTAFSVITYTE